MARVLLRLAVLAAAVAVAAAASDECLAKPECYLTKAHCEKPVPSLTQCYKYNQEACCVAGHDSVIKSEYESLWSTTCLREYANLELLYCLGCDLDQGSYVNVTGKQVRICQSFANNLFNPAAGSRNTYDNCGVLLQSGDVILPGVATTAEGYTLFNTSYDFINYNYVHQSSTYYPFRAPFFKDFEHVIVSDGDDCFSSGALRIVISMFAVAVVAISSLLLA